jgi:hypothetical protein
MTFDAPEKCKALDAMKFNSAVGNAFRKAPAERFSVTRYWTSLLRLDSAFFVGFCIQFNILLGGGGERASATGGYGYRLMDFVCLGVAGLLGFYSLAPRRILPLILYGLIIGALFVSPSLSPDPRTAILAYHYILYSFSALYIVVILDDNRALESFCWGLIIGLLATVPIFVLQDSAYSSKLIEWGLTPGYTQVFASNDVGFLRYSGLSGHPNEAGHVAALSAAAGAYFGIVRRRMLPVVLVSAGLLAIFYYTRSRGGLIAGGAILIMPFLVSRGRISLLRFAVMLAVLVITLIVLTQIDFIASRFGADANAANNMSDRLDSILSGLQVMFSNPLGMPILEFISYVAAGSGGVESPHNGFIFLGGVFGLLTLCVFLVSCAVNFRVRSETDIFFALLTLQVAISFLFEQLPESYSYALAVCLIGARAFMRTPLGVYLKLHDVPYRPMKWT